MARVIVENGFPNSSGGVFLTGTLISGLVEKRDKLIDDKTKIDILDIELDTTTFPGIIKFVMTFSEDNKIIWHRLYRRTFLIESTSHNGAK